MKLMIQGSGFEFRLHLRWPRRREEANRCTSAPTKPRAYSSKGGSEWCWDLMGKAGLTQNISKSFKLEDCQSPSGKAQSPQAEPVRPSSRISEVQHRSAYTHMS